MMIEYYGMFERSILRMLNSTAQLACENIRMLKGRYYIFYTMRLMRHTNRDRTIDSGSYNSGGHYQLLWEMVQSRRWNDN